MAGFRIRPPGTRHAFPRLGVYRTIMFRRMNLPNWPPDGASPLHPIEPWGRQFVVFNAHETAAPSDSSTQPRGPFPRLPPVVEPTDDAKTRAARGDSLLSAVREKQTHLPSPAKTVMCVMDYARRPLMFLCHEDFKTFKKNLPRLKEQLQIFKQKLRPNMIHEKYDLRRQLLPYKQYAMQRLKTGEHDGHGIIRGTIREKKT
ncbi:hypothetical protein CSUI_003993 [Cystoisospora suis]|uniref:Uncharacterized protein n=1 Tax=Cystoisospora suis TaxID=483139 RepID=A0A2C6KNU4_9APIC|nr:hypothetical protein CSUI_003993 [Cystoisospora suis]